MNTFLKRTLTSIIFVIVVLGAVTWNRWSCAGLFFVLTLGCLWEYYGLIRNPKSEIRNSKWMGMTIGGIIFLASAFVAFLGQSQGLPLLVICLRFLFFIFELFSRNKQFINLSLNVLGLIYIAIPFSLTNFLIDSNILVGIFLLIWTNDTMAYLIGSQIGKHKLFERISPKKTWEGSIGGAIFTLILAYFLNMLLPWIFGFDGEFSRADWIVIGLIVIIFGTLGDLVESLLKRNLAIKDTGSILPGHGGLLDRFDAFLFSFPFILSYILLFT